MGHKKYHKSLSCEFRQTIWNQGFITGFQLLKIGAWKSAQSVANLTVNSDEDIRRCTASTLIAIQRYRAIDVVKDEVDWDDWEACVATAIGQKRAPSTGILQLHGVGYPMATAVLATLIPSAFPVMDRWAISEVFGVDIREAQKSKYHRSARYREYCRALAKSTRQELTEDMNVHLRDQFLMNFAMNRRKVLN